MPGESEAVLPCQQARQAGAGGNEEGDRGVLDPQRDDDAESIGKPRADCECGWWRSEGPYRRPECCRESKAEVGDSQSAETGGFHG